MGKRLWRAAADNAAKNHTVKNNHNDFAFWINLCVVLAILMYSVLGCIDPGLNDAWSHFKSIRKIWLLLGAGSSISLAYMVMLRTAKQKGYVNFLWLVLPVLMIMVLEFLFQFDPQEGRMAWLESFGWFHERRNLA